MKRAYNIEKQIQSMKNNGVTFDNINKAKEILLDIGFYRIGFYSFPFEKSFPRLIIFIGFDKIIKKFAYAPKMGHIL